MLLDTVSPNFKGRRDRLMAERKGDLFLLPAAPHLLRNPDVHYPYRQESNFFYLSGFEEPESVIALQSKPNGGYRFVLFLRERNIERELWDGERYGLDRAKTVFGADETYPIGTFETKLQELLKDSERVFYRLGQDEGFDRKVIAGVERARQSFGRSGRGVATLLDPSEALGEMRIKKDSEEASHLRKAGEISGLAHRTLMETTRPGMNEAEVEARVDYEFKKNGCSRNGYGSIVGGGVNACCLHYVSNNAVLKEGDLLLVDAGGEYAYYTADITRTFPVGKKFTAEQAAVYDLVLSAQKQVIALVKPDVVYETLHARCSEILCEGLIRLGHLQGDRDENLKNGELKRYFPHGTGHLLGMDVHDVGLYKVQGKSRVLEPGMVFTVEPGLYYQTYDSKAPKAFRGIGIRIEDNILVTGSGHEVLTASAPKERAEIEALRARAF